MIAQTSAVLSEYLAAAEGGEHHAEHNAYLVGVCVFIALVLMLLATLSFNRDR